MEPVYSPVITAGRILFAAQGLKFRLEGIEHIPREGGAVMAINHTGYFDFTYAGYAGIKAGRYVRFMAKQSIFGHRVAGPLMRGMKHIPVDRHAGAASFRAALAALKAGEIVGVFPEATMSRSLEIKELKSGAVRMAQLARVPILPTTIWGSHRVWTKEAPKHLGRSGIPVFVTVGAPMTVDRKDDAEAATARLKEAMTSQLHVQQEAYPPLTGDDLRYLPARLGGTAPSVAEAHEADLRDMQRTKDRFNS